MLSLITSEAFVKAIASFLGPVLLILAAFLYGVHQANRTAKIDQLDEEKKIQHNVNSAERMNQELEAKKDEKLNAVRNTTIVDDLIKLWSKSGWGPKS